MDTTQQLLKNWTDSSPRYSGIVQAELGSFRKRAWQDLVRENCGREGELDVLDIGTGPGFFPIILSELGWDVTAVDYTQAMVDTARANCAAAGVKADIRRGDAHALEFADASFDLIVNRNVAWTLLNAAKAFAEWRRVLRPGGRALIFDANWNRYLFDAQLNERYQYHMAEVARRYGPDAVPRYSEEMLAYRRNCPMCARVRPGWDLQTLADGGWTKLTCVLDIGPRVYDEQERFVNALSPMFMIVAEK